MNHKREKKNNKKLQKVWTIRDFEFFSSILISFE